MSLIYTSCDICIVTIWTVFLIDAYRKAKKRDREYAKQMKEMWGSDDE